MYENIITIHSVLKKKATQLNFQPTQYLKKLAKIILKKKEEKKKKKSIFDKKKKKKKHIKKKQKQKKNCYSQKPTRFRVFVNKVTNKCQLGPHNV